MHCVQYGRRAEGEERGGDDRRCRGALTLSPDFPTSSHHFPNRKDSLSRRVISKARELPLLVFLASLCVVVEKETTLLCLFLPQRDAQVARREPEKAFGHQPSAQAAQVLGGGRGHQGRPQVLALGGGHQQRVH